MAQKYARWLYVTEARIEQAIRKHRIHGARFPRISRRHAARLPKNNRARHLLLYWLLPAADTCRPVLCFRDFQFVSDVSRVFLSFLRPLAARFGFFEPGPRSRREAVL